MSERGVRVVFSPETPRRTALHERLMHRAEGQDHSNVATNVRTSRAARGYRVGPARLPRGKGDLVKAVRNRLPDEGRLRRVRTTFATLADQQRLKIVIALAVADELCVSEVADVLRTSVSVASHHLRRLRDLEVVEDRGDGKLAYYSLRQRYVATLAVMALRSPAR